jgi:hypothetical protein
MGRRIQSRASNGRYRRATLANTFGLVALICEDCRRINPVEIGKPKPTECHACGSERLT